jgi:gamma-glutamylputrescine oxidase
MARATHVGSWYAASTPPAVARAALHGEAVADVCVVGGGIAGCSTALHLAQRGYSVVLLEEHRVGWGASGRNGGQAIFGLACGQDRLESLLPGADARAAWDVSVAGLGLLRELVAQHAIDCDLVAGQMHVAIKPRQLRELAAEHDDLRNRLGYDSVRLLDRAALRAVLASDRYIGGLHDSNGAHLHPLKYTLGLAAAAERAGVRIHEGSRALSWERDGSGLRAHTVRGEVRCRQLALCGNAYIGAMAPQLDRRIMPVATYMVATEPLGAAQAGALIANDAAVSDTNWVLDYYRRSADHRLLFGGRVSYSGVDPFNTAAATRRRMLNVFPQLVGVAVDYSWGGFVDISLNRAPDFGRLAPDVFYLQGFSGHGLALTGIAGQMLAEAIAGTAERFDVFARIPHREFPGGRLLRRPALVLGMLWYRLRDLL